MDYPSLSPSSRMSCMAQRAVGSTWEARANRFYINTTLAALAAVCRGTTVPPTLRTSSLGGSKPKTYTWEAVPVQVALSKGQFSVCTEQELSIRGPQPPHLQTFTSDKTDSPGLCFVCQLSLGLLIGSPTWDPNSGPTNASGAWSAVHRGHLTF